MDMFILKTIQVQSSGMAMKPPGADLETADKRKNPCCASSMTCSQASVWWTPGWAVKWLHVMMLVTPAIASRLRVAGGPSSKVDVYSTTCRKESLPRQPPAMAYEQTPMQPVELITSCHGNQRFHITRVA